MASTKKKSNNYTDNVNKQVELPPPPDGGWGWIVVIASFLIHIIIDGMTYSFGILYVQLVNDFDEGKGYTSWILSVLVGMTLCSGPIASFFVNKCGCRSVAIAGSVLAGACLLCSAYAQNVLTLIFTIGFGTGFGLGFIYLPAIISVTTYFEKYRSLATGIAVCGSGFGTFIFAPLVDYFVKAYGWRGTLISLSGIVLNCALFGALFRPLKAKTRDISLDQLNDMYDVEKHSKTGTETQASENMISKEEKNGEAQLKFSQKADQEMANSSLESEGMLNANCNTKKPWRSDILNTRYEGPLQKLPENRRHGELSTQSHRYESIRKINKNMISSTASIEVGTNVLNLSLLADPIFILFTLSNFCTNLGFNVPYVYIADQAKVLQLSTEEASYLLSVIGIANTIGRIIIGYLSDKSWVNRLWVYNVCLIVCGSATALSIFCYDFKTLALCSSIFGFTIGAYVGLAPVILVDLLGLGNVTDAFGLLVFFAGIASFVGPPIVGSLYDRTLSYTSGFVFAGLMIVVSGLMLFSIPSLQKYLARRHLRLVNKGQYALAVMTS